MLNKIFFTSAIAMLIIILSACGSGQSNKQHGVKPNPGAGLETGRYKFSLYDSTDNPLAELELNIETSDNAGFSGTSAMIKAYSENFKGYSNLNSGKFTGEYNQYDKTAAVVNMNPNTYDNNVYLTLNLSGTKISGTWSYSTFAGVLNHGKVKQIK